MPRANSTIKEVRRKKTEIRKERKSGDGRQRPPPAQRKIARRALRKGFG